MERDLSYEEHTRKLRNSRLWSADCRQRPSREWETQLEEIFDGVPLKNAGDIFLNRWVNAYLDLPPAIEDESPDVPKMPRLFNDQGLNDFITARLTDKRPLVSASTQVTKTNGEVEYGLSYSARDPTDPAFILRREYSWSDTLGYIIITRTHQEDMIKSSVEARNSYVERKISPHDYLEISTLIDVLVTADLAGQVEFNS